MTGLAFREGSAVSGKTRASIAQAFFWLWGSLGFTSPVKHPSRPVGGVGGG